MHFLVFENMVLNYIKTLLRFPLFHVLREPLITFQAYKQFNEESMLSSSSAQKHHNQQQNELQTPVANEQVKANILFEVTPVKLIYSVKHAVVSLCQDLFSSLNKGHEVSHVVASTCDGSGIHIQKATAFR